MGRGRGRRGEVGNIYWKYLFTHLAISSNQDEQLINDFYGPVEGEWNKPFV